MARAKKKAGHGQSERWLISYADLLTLLFAFFVVMFASSQTDKRRNHEISEAVKEAFESNGLGTKRKPVVAKPVVKQPTVPKPVESPIVKPVKQPELANPMDALKKSLGGEIELGQVALHLEPRGLIISLNAQAVFPLGGDTVDSTMYSLLGKIAAIVSPLPNPVRLEGHTDSLPISTDRFHSNWELSAARSIAVLRVLIDRYDIDRERMTIAGYADTNPIGDNATEEGRTKNRRVDIVILNRGDH